MTSGGSSAASSGGGPSFPAVSDAKWSLVVPFKGGPGAKSRLQGNRGPGTIGPGLRRELALGFLGDTVTAAAGAASVGCVFIVSSDPAAVMDAPNIRILPDPGQGLNAAIAAGFAFARSLNTGNPVAAVTADLPCLTAADLDYALRLAKHRQLAVVPDRHGTGTTMVSALPGVPIRPLFGHHSRDAHLLAGHSLLAIPYHSTLRADVDTLGDLAAAIQRGVGEHTWAALHSSGLLSPPPPPAGDRPESCLFQLSTVQRKSCPAF
jgi:2-phospho-L-lactate/phosphoenolpyruvate guanylyltransferase